MAELREIRDAMKSVSPDRLMMVSHGGGDVTNAIQAARQADLDIVALHQEQKTNWHEDTAAQVKKLRTVGRPIYIQESGRATMRGERYRGANCDATGEGNPFVKAMVEAMRAGAAAWTFHTDAAFGRTVNHFSASSRHVHRRRRF